MKMLSYLDCLTVFSFPFLNFIPVRINLSSPSNGNYIYQQPQLDHIIAYERINSQRSTFMAILDDDVGIATFYGRLIRETIWSIQK